MSELKHEINEANLADVTGGAVWETADEKWERLAMEMWHGDSYYIGKPCPRCEASSRGRYPLYCDKLHYLHGDGFYLCFNCAKSDGINTI